MVRVSISSWRWCFVASWGCLFFFHIPSNAQSQQACDLMAQRIAGNGNVNAICSNLYQVCTSEASKKSEPKEEHNQCLKNLGDCQMAGQLSGEDLQRVVAEYERACKAP
jgi:hypothetical protein